MSLTVDLQPHDPVLLASVAHVAITLDATTDEANYTTGVITLDATLGHPGAVTLDAGPTNITTDSVVGGAISVDAQPGSQSTVGPGTMATITLDIDGCSGPPGPSGPAGPSGEGGIYRWHQAAAATQWTIVHGLVFYPSVSITDTAGTQIWADVTYVDENTVQVDLAQPLAGYANLS